MQYLRSSHSDVSSPKAAAALVLETYWDGELPVKPEEIARSMGVELIPRGGPGDSGYQFSGYFSLVDGEPEIEFNMSDSLVRRRFTVAHELGHFALRHGNSPRDKPENFGTAVKDPRERAANQFAAEILMPAFAIRSMISQGYDSVEELADLFKVSRTAMGYRLANLSLSLR